MLRLYRRYLDKYFWQAVLAPVFKMLEAVFALFVPIVIKNIIDRGLSASGGIGYIISQGLLLLALAVIGFASTMVCQVFSVRTAAVFGYYTRRDLYGKIDSFSMKEFERFGSSSLETRLLSDVPIAQNGLSLLLRLAIRAPFLVIGSIIMSFFVAPELVWVFAAVGISLGLVIYLISSLSVPLNSNIQRGLDKVTSLLVDDLAGTRVIRAFGKESFEYERFCRSADSLQRISDRLARISAFLNPMNIMLVNIGIICIIYFGSWHVSAGSLTQGDIVALINYLGQISVAIVVIANLVSVFSKASSSSQRISEVLDCSLSMASGDETARPTEKAIVFRNVTFAYSSDSVPALRNLSLEIRQGETIGIIGGTGAGKTTLAELIDRLYDPTSGCISFYGCDLRNWNLTALRKKISIASQRAVLFSGSIESNISMGLSGRKDIAVPLAISQSADIVAGRPEGLGANVFQNGENFSGGQRQRLSIARALARRPEVLVLDDSVSALDYRTELEFRKSLKDSKGRMTVIIISQRISSIADADRILVLDKGELVGCGSPADLYDSCRVFREIADSQSEGRQIS